MVHQRRIPILTSRIAAEERLYWVLNHREGISAMRMKPDFISEVRFEYCRFDLAHLLIKHLSLQDEHGSRSNGSGGRAPTRMYAACSPARGRRCLILSPHPSDFDPSDQCHIQHTSEGYSKQVLPPEFKPYDREEIPTDDTCGLFIP